MQDEVSMTYRMKQLAKLAFAIGLLLCVSYIAGEAAFRLGFIIGSN